MHGNVKWPQLSSVIFGKGSLQQLQEIVADLGAKRAVIITVSSLAEHPLLLTRIRALLGPTFAGVYAKTKQHVPDTCVVEATKFVRERDADLLISLGGSSATDTTKGVNLALAEASGSNYQEFFARYSALGEAAARQNFSRPKLPHIAIPTTFSGAEFSSSVGITDTASRRKFALVDPRITPSVIILDPEATLQTPPALLASTALKVMADAFEEICSPRHLPLVDSLALGSIRIIDRNFHTAISTAVDLEARAKLQHAAWMCESVKALTGLGLVTALRHQIGGMFNVPHGIASSIVFSAGIQFNRPAIDERLALIATALGIAVEPVSAAADAALHRVQDLIQIAGLPSKLRHVGVSYDQLSQAAEAVMGDRQTRNNPVTVKSVDDVRQLLQQIW